MMRWIRDILNPRGNIVTCPTTKIHAQIRQVDNTTMHQREKTTDLVYGYTIEERQHVLLEKGDEN